jgi:hypothetical protein
MVDTIILRIHDLKRHESCVKYLHQREFKGISKFTKDIEVTEKLKTVQDVIDNIPGADKREFLNQEMKDFEFAAYDARGFLKRSHTYNYWTDFATGRVIEEKYRAHLPSYHYELAYCIDFSRDFIEFNFSIPKYLYLTNIFQFVPHFWDKHYSPSINQTIQSMVRPTYEQLRNFISWFFDVTFNGHVDKFCIEIARIDLCFNKIFNSKDEALLYINDLKRMRKKYLKESKSPSSFQTGIHFVHKDYTFKIYHKGLEFQVHDKCKLKKRLSPDKLERLQQFSDRMVRYELECRPGIMNTVFKRKIFRSDSKTWKRAYRHFGQFRRDGSIISGGSRFYTSPPLADSDGVELTKKERKEMTITPEQKRSIKYGKFYYDKVFHFMLSSKSKLAESSSLWDAEIFNSQFTFEREQKFGFKMYSGLVNQFQFFFNQFSITYQDDLSYRMGKIQSMYPDVKQRSRELQYQAADKTGIPVKQFRMISFTKVQHLLQLLKDRSLSELKDFIPDTTFRRYKKFLELYGFKDFAPINYVFKSDDTFETYYRLLEEVNPYPWIKFLSKTPF